MGRRRRPRAPRARRAAAETAFWAPLICEATLPTTWPPAPITKATRTCTSRPPSTSQLGFQRRCSSSVRPVSAAAERPVPTAGRACCGGLRAGRALGGRRGLGRGGLDHLRDAGGERVEVEALLRLDRRGGLHGRQLLGRLGRLGRGRRRRGRGLAAPARPTPSALRGPAPSVWAVCSSGACDGGPQVGEGALATMVTGTTVPTFRSRAKFQEIMNMTATVACSSTDPIALARSPGGSWRGRQFRRVLVARQGPPVSVIRLIEVKPEVDSAAITWATIE